MGSISTSPRAIACFMIELHVFAAFLAVAVRLFSVAFNPRTKQTALLMLSGNQQIVG